MMSHITHISHLSHLRDRPAAGVYDEACEVLFDDEFSGATDLGGRVAGSCGAYLPLDLLLNTSRLVNP